MKYIHGGYIKGKVSAGAIVKIFFGCIFFILTLVMLFIMATSSSEDEIIISVIYSLIFFAPATFLFIFFGFRGLIKSLRGYPRHNLALMLPMDMSNPFYTTQCERCGIIFDYQYSDLGYRAWYRDGYVECPRCKQPRRHNATVNGFRKDEIMFR